jgi:VWFA-related protein
MTRRALLLVGSVWLLAGLVAAQSPPPVSPQPPVTFRVEVNYVEVDAIVTDERGNFVGDLTKDDFQVFEDGKPQTVTVFARVEIPIERAEQPLYVAAPVEPDVATNERPFDGRLYVLVLDDLHTHPLRSARVKAAARQFIERHLGANDLAAVVFTSGRADAAQDFTNSRRLLLAAVDKFIGRKLRSATLERIEEYMRRRETLEVGETVDDPYDLERAHQARTALETLKHVAEYLEGIRGRRKALLYISEGIDYDIHNPWSGTPTSKQRTARPTSLVLDAMRDAIGVATRGNVSFYTIDPRGLTALGDEVIEIGGLPEDTSIALDQRALQQELQLSQDSLRVLAEETGGFAAVNSNDFVQAFDRIVRDSSSYYVLGYYPTNDRRDGRFRKIEVRVRRPGVTVRARRGYVAPRGRAPETRTTDGGSGPSPELREVLASPLPTSGLTLQVAAAPFRGEAPKASLPVIVQIRGSDLHFTERDGAYLDNLELVVQAVDDKGKVAAGDRQTVDFKLRPETYRAVLQGGFRMISRLAVPPGRYTLVVAARETGAGRSGSIHHTVEVPDFAKGPLALSGIVLTAASAARTPTARPDPDLKELLPGPPTTAREFRAGDILALFVEVYDNEPSRPHKVEITTTVRAADGRVVFKAEETRSSEELQGRRGGYGHTVQIPLRDLGAGLYVIRVEARSRLDEDTVVAREVPFRIQ